jgi:hypothetical protein
VPVKLLYRRWKQSDPTLPALSAVYRWLEQNDLDAQGRRYLLRQSIPGPTKAFEAPGVNDLWIVATSLRAPSWLCIPRRWPLTCA